MRNDVVDRKIRKIGADRMLNAVKAHACSRCECIYLGVPKGAMQPACCDPSSKTYLKKITHIETCRRWRR